MAILSTCSCIGLYEPQETKRKLTLRQFPKIGKVRDFFKTQLANKTTVSFSLCRRFRFKREQFSRNAFRGRPKTGAHHVLPGLFDYGKPNTQLCGETVIVAKTVRTCVRRRYFATFGFRREFVAPDGRTGDGVFKAFPDRYSPSPTKTTAIRSATTPPSRYTCSGRSFVLARGKKKHTCVIEFHEKRFLLETPSRKYPSGRTRPALLFRNGFSKVSRVNVGRKRYSDWAPVKIAFFRTIRLHGLPKRLLMILPQNPNTCFLEVINFRTAVVGVHSRYNAIDPQNDSL